LKPSISSVRKKEKGRGKIWSLRERGGGGNVASAAVNGEEYRKVARKEGLGSVRNPQKEKKDITPDQRHRYGKKVIFGQSHG